MRSTIVSNIETIRAALVELDRIEDNTLPDGVVFQGEAGLAALDLLLEALSKV